MRPGPAFVAWVLGCVAALGLWALLYPVLIGALQEQDAQQQLFARFRSQLAQATAPLGPTGLGKPVALVSVPAAGVRNAVVVEGTSGVELEKGPGHLRSTVLPGQVGTAEVLGRAITFGAPFAHLGELRPGDPITVTTGQGSFTFRVEQLRGPGDPLPVPPTATQSRLVLATASGAGWRTHAAPTTQLYVDALLDGTVVPAPTTGARGAVPASEQVMGVSTEPLMELVIWLLGLLVAAAGAVWLTTRWGRRRTWLVAVPVLLAVGIGASTAAGQLLPNVL
jgi:sortase A